MHWSVTIHTWGFSSFACTPGFVIYWLALWLLNLRAYCDSDVTRRDRYLKCSKFPIRFWPKIASERSFICCPSLSKQTGWPFTKLSSSSEKLSSLKTTHYASLILCSSTLCTMWMSPYMRFVKSIIVCFLNGSIISSWEMPLVSIMIAETIECLHVSTCVLTSLWIPDF